MLVQPLMRSRRVEVAQAALLEHLREMPLAKSHHVVEAFRSALVPPEDRSFHPPCHHDELLAQQGVLSHQLRARSQQVSREPPTIEHGRGVRVRS